MRPQVTMNVYNHADQDENENDQRRKERQLPARDVSLNRNGKVPIHHLPQDNRAQEQHQNAIPEL